MRPTTCMAPITAGAMITQRSVSPVSRSKAIMCAGKAAVTPSSNTTNTPISQNVGWRK